MIDRTTIKQEGNEFKNWGRQKTNLPSTGLMPVFVSTRRHFISFGEISQCLNKKTPTGKESYVLFCRGGEI
jgi:hypothetical protein